MLIYLQIGTPLPWKQSPATYILLVNFTTITSSPKTTIIVKLYPSTLLYRSHYLAICFPKQNFPLALYHLYKILCTGIFDALLNIIHLDLMVYSSSILCKVKHCFVVSQENPPQVTAWSFLKISFELHPLFSQLAGKFKEG